jgi:hypothetical protein
VTGRYGWCLLRVKGKYHPLAKLALGHFLTCFVLTHLEVSLMVTPYFFRLLVCSILIFSVIYNRTFLLHVATNFFCVHVFCPKLGLCLFLLLPCVCFVMCISVSCCFSRMFHLCCCYSSYISCANGPFFTTV